MAEKRYWLMKSEPNAYSFTDLMNEDDSTAEWDGVRNYQARNTMRDDMKPRRRCHILPLQRQASRSRRNCRHRARRLP